jgi:ATP-dependent DNA helicase RecG
MRELSEIRSLLDELEQQSADRLEGQDLNFKLRRMETDLGYLERGGTGRGTYWTLRHDLHRRLSAPGHPERNRRIEWEAAKTRVVSVLRQRAQRQEPGLTNAEIRKITHFDRSQVKRLMAELAQEDTAYRDKRGRGAKWFFKGEGD